MHIWFHKHEVYYSVDEVNKMSETEIWEAVSYIEQIEKERERLMKEAREQGRS